MIITDLILENVRQFEKLELRNLPETGVVVISGENESGKSTIQQAFDALLRIRHGSKSNDVKSLRRRDPITGQPSELGPSVEMHALFGENKVVIHKQWLAKARSSLIVDGPNSMSVSGREADDAFEELLKNYTDEKLRDVLIVPQDKVAAKITASGIQPLSRAMEKELRSDSPDGAVPDLDTGDALMEAIVNEYRKYYTAKKGDESREYAAAGEQVRKVAAKRDEVRGKVEELEKAAHEVTRSETELERLSGQLTEVAEQKKEIEERSRKADALAQMVESTRAQRMLRKRELDDLCDERDRRKTLKQSIQAKKKALALAQAESQELSTEAEEHERNRTRLKNGHEQATAVLRDAQQSLKKVQHDIARAKLVVEYSRSYAVLEKIRDVAQELEELQQPSPRVSRKQVAELEEAELNLRFHEQVARAQYARIDIAGPDGERVLVDGEEHAVGDSRDPLSVELRGETALSLGDFHLTYHPGKNADSTEDDSDVETAREAFSQMLSQLGVDDVAAARKAAQATEDYEHLRKRLSERVAELLPVGVDSIPDLEDSCAKLYQQIEAMACDDTEEDPGSSQQSVQDRIESIENAAIDPAVAVAELRRLEDEEARANDEVRDREEARDALQQALNETSGGGTERRLLELGLQIERTAADIEAATESLQDLKDKTSDEDLATRINDAERSFEEAVIEDKQAQSKIADLDPEAVKRNLEALRAEYTNKAKRREKLLKVLHEAKGRIASAQGIHEEYERICVEYEAADYKRKQLDRKAHGARRLYEVMTKHYRQAREHYTAPYLDRFSALAKIVFGPDAEFSADESLAITGRTVGRNTFDIASLSGGAQEQIALLERLTVAQMIDDQDACPVIIDDALGNTDPTRLRSMGRVLTEIGKNRQVIVLSCYPERFDSVSAAETYRMDELG